MLKFFLDPKNNQLRPPMLPLLPISWVEWLDLWPLELQIYLVIHQLYFNLHVLELILHLLDSKADNWTWCGLSSCSGNRYTLLGYNLSCNVLPCHTRIISNHDKILHKVWGNLLQWRPLCPPDLDSSYLNFLVVSWDGARVCLFSFCLVSNSISLLLECSNIFARVLY